MILRRMAVATGLLGSLLLLPLSAFAHAHLVSSQPAANSAVKGPKIAIDLSFNSRVETKGSMIQLVMPGGKTQRLTLDRQSGDTNLYAHAQLKPGSYSLQWQALSTDGHITRGEVPFSVR